MVFVSSAIKCRILVCLLLAIKDLGFLCWPVFVFVFGRVKNGLAHCCSLNLREEEVGWVSIYATYD